MTRAAGHAHADGLRSPESCIYSPELEDAAARVLRAAEARKLRLVTAESCTGGALSALLTDVEGFGHVFERGFLTYTAEAKADCLGVSALLLAREGAVSRAAAAAMARGALDRSPAEIAVAITGNAGPAGPRAEEGLVYVCVMTQGGAQRTVEHHFGAEGRAGTRMKTLESALDLIDWVVETP